MRDETHLFNAKICKTKRMKQKVLWLGREYLIGKKESSKFDMIISWENVTISHNMQRIATISLHSLSILVCSMD